jgi:hypothetical protein
VSLVNVTHATRAVEKGEELINNYGQHDAAELLIKYGVFYLDKDGGTKVGGDANGATSGVADGGD